MLEQNGEYFAQTAKLHQILAQNGPLYDFLCKARNLSLPNYALGAGCIAQTVWNFQSGLDLMHGISDFDFVYYDSQDTSYEGEDRVTRAVRALLSENIQADVKNQARVHLWYEAHFGYEIAPYASLEAAIDTWPTTATAVAVRLEGEDLRVYAPFGLSDLFGRVVRPNKKQITKEIYEKKAAKWIEKWPDLTIVPW